MVIATFFTLFTFAGHVANRILHIGPLDKTLLLVGQCWANIGLPMLGQLLHANVGPMFDDVGPALIGIVLFYLPLILLNFEAN